MIIDTSALIAILFNEREASQIERAIERDPTRMLSAASLLETSIVVEVRFGPVGGRELDLLLYKAGVEIVPVNSAQVDLARQAYRRFGKGRHPASLNFGDCFSYALSKHSGEPLLFKGDDFGRTDIVSVPLIAL